MTFFLFTLNMTFAFFDTFGLVHAVTQGGPGDATSILVYKAWKDGFEGLQLGISAAQSVILMAVVIGLTAFQFRFAEKKVNLLMARERLASARAGASPPRAPAAPPGPWAALIAHAILIGSVAVLAFPLYYAFVISTQTVERGHQPAAAPAAVDGDVRELRRGVEAGSHMGRLLLNSAVMALAIAFGKIAISMLSAFAIVYFDFRGKMIVFWMIFVTLMLPIPVRIVSTYEVIEPASAG